jgi:hypothetical protein
MSTLGDCERRFDFADLLRHRDHYWNLVIMNVAWSSTSFGYYLISYYLKYLPGDIFANVIWASLAEILSSFFSAHFSQKLGN